VIVRKGWSIVPTFESLPVVDTYNRVGQQEKNGTDRKQKIREERGSKIIGSPRHVGGFASQRVMLGKHEPMRLTWWKMNVDSTLSCV
jgi:hypothetical protein